MPRLSQRSSTSSTAICLLDVLLPELRAAGEAFGAPYRHRSTVSLALKTASQGSVSDTPLSGAILDRAVAAALDHTGGGEVTETEVGDDGAAYGVEVRLEDGSHVEVNLGGEDDGEPEPISLDDRPLLEVEMVLVSNLLVPARVRDVIESFEPGRHRFVPAQIAQGGEVIAAA